jgi:hypothetical protein
MKKLLLLAVVAGFVVSVSGCAIPSGSPVYGGLVTANVKGPVGMGDAAVKPAKTGMAQASAIVFFATGDCSIEAAMKNGGITKVHHVDCEAFSILGLYATYKTVVYGE